MIITLPQGGNTKKGDKKMGGIFWSSFKIQLRLDLFFGLIIILILGQEGVEWRFTMKKKGF